MNVSVILLAAGSSSRMGQSKQLLPIHQTTLLQNAIDTAQQAVPGKLLVVLGARAHDHQRVLSSSTHDVVINDQWEKGMGNSLKFGLEKLLQIRPETEAILVMVCDQPAVTADHLQKLLQAYQEYPEKIICSSYANTRGVPALFPKIYFSKIKALADIEGARKIIQTEREFTEAIPLAHGEFDLDTPEDYQRWINQTAGK